MEPDRGTVTVNSTRSVVIPLLFARVSMYNSFLPGETSLIVHVVALVVHLLPELI
jgi:hypothetical protein